MKSNETAGANKNRIFVIKGLEDFFPIMHIYILVVLSDNDFMGSASITNITTNA